MMTMMMTIKTIRMAHHTRPLGTTLGLALFVILLNSGDIAGRAPEEPDLRLRSTPRVAFAPAEVLFVAELRGGDDDYRDLYCVTVEWDWDDETRSESTPDCDPYEPGVSKIRRRYSTRHRFDYGGRYQVRIHLKRRDDVVASANTSIEIRGNAFRR